MMHDAGWQMAVGVDVEGSGSIVAVIETPPSKDARPRGNTLPDGRNPDQVGRAYEASPRIPRGGRHQRCSLVIVRLLRRNSIADLASPSLVVSLSNHSGVTASR